MRDPTLQAMFDQLKELVLQNRGEEFNLELGMVGDYLEEKGDPEYKLCRVTWRIFPDPPTKHGKGNPDTHWIRFGFPPKVVFQQEMRDFWNLWSVNSHPLLFIPAKSMGICNLPPFGPRRCLVGLYWVVEGMDEDYYGGENQLRDFHYFFRGVP